MGTLPLVLLAGGKGSRAGRSKGLITWHGEPWAIWQLRSFARAGGREAVIVLGHEVQAYHAFLSPGPFLRIAVNPEPERGPFSSIQIGITALPAHARGAFVLPVDVPAPASEVWQSLASALQSAPHEAADDALDAAIPTFEDRGGHPVLLSRRFCARLAVLSPAAPDARLDLQLAGARTRRVAVGDPRVRLNLNTEADFAALNHEPR
jgi:CTP:molybdopterin cytidylyltransferase MocA